MDLHEMLEETESTWNITPIHHYEDKDVEILYISTALNGELGELQNKIKKLFRKKYYTEGHSSDSIEAEIPEEIADVLYYFLRLCKALDIDIEKAFADKMKINRERYSKSSK
ncbi:MAG: MazG nucleotide pyrophosphohydrolase domain-containing protein [Candidatus Micrarchaeia archaeon]